MNLISKSVYIRPENARIYAGIFFSSFMYIACTAPQTNQLQVEKPHDLPEQAIISNVPFFPQEQFHCGPATLAMAMNHYNIEITPKELAKDVFTPNLKGSLQVEMKAASRQQGMLAYELTPKLVYLLAEVSVGHPVIVLQNLAIKVYPVWHYALVIGYDLNSKIIILHTGLNEKYEISMKTFEHTWNRGNNWALVVLPSDRLPNDHNQKNILQAAVDLEQVGKIENANEAYKAISNRWPNNYVAVMGLANTYLRLNEPHKATENYLRATKIKPRQADVYNNLAYSLHAQACANASLQSIQCAIMLEPDNLEFQDSLKEISHLKTETTEQSCPEVVCPK